jgi:site-specific recombinase XerD
VPGLAEVMAGIERQSGALNMLLAPSIQGFQAALSRRTDELVKSTPHLGTRQYARIVDNWVRQIGLDPAPYRTHSMRCTTASLIYRRTKNLRAVQLLLGHAKGESTVRYLGIEVDDALEMAEDTET